MAPVAAAAYVLIAAFAVSAVLLGAFGGAAAWAVRGSPVWGGLLVTGGLLATALLGSYRLTSAAVIGMPPLILTYLTSWLTARALEQRAGVRHVWATVAGLVCALLAGFVYLRLLGLALGFPSS